MKKIFLFILFFVSLSFGMNDSISVDLLFSPMLQNHHFSFDGMKILNPFPHQNEIQTNLKFSNQLYYKFGAHAKYKWLNLEGSVAIDNFLGNFNNVVDKNAAVLNTDGNIRYMINRFDPNNPVETNQPKEIGVINDIMYYSSLKIRMHKFLNIGFYFESSKWEFYDFTPPSNGKIIYYDSLKFPITKVFYESYGILVASTKKFNKIRGFISLRYGLFSNYKIKFPEIDLNKKYNLKYLGVKVSLNWKIFFINYSYANMRTEKKFFQHSLHSFNVGIKMNIMKTIINFGEL
jgi:hypothetical protein